MMAGTTFLLDLARGDPGARAALEELERGSEALRVPAPALAKLWEGVERARTRPREAAALRDLLLGVAGAPFEGAHAVLAARILAQAARAGAPLDPFDAMTAAMAVAEDETLLTRNARELAGIADLRVRTY